MKTKMNQLLKIFDLNSKFTIRLDCIHQFFGHILSQPIPKFQEYSDNLKEICLFKNHFKKHDKVMWQILLFLIQKTSKYYRIILVFWQFLIQKYTVKNYFYKKVWAFICSFLNLVLNPFKVFDNRLSFI